MSPETFGFQINIFSLFFIIYLPTLYWYSNAFTFTFACNQWRTTVLFSLFGIEWDSSWGKEWMSGGDIRQGGGLQRKEGEVQNHLAHFSPGLFCHPSEFAVEIRHREITTIHIPSSTNDWFEWSMRAIKKWAGPRPYCTKAACSINIYVYRIYTCLSVCLNGNNGSL